MKTQSAWWVVAGDFRIRCQTQESVKGWISYIVAGGGVPQVEAVQ